MKSPLRFMTIVPAAGTLPSPVATSFLSKLAAISSARRENEAKGQVSRPLPPPVDPGEKPGGDWLFTEDEYFFFDADGFEER